MVMSVKRRAADRRQLVSPTPLLGLVMIVKNETHGIRETLESFKSHIDRWTILDTGSTDGTQDVIREALRGVPGELHEEPFVDFATSRNRALELHGTSTLYTIMPDSDDRLVNADELRRFLSRPELDTKEPAFTVNLRRGELSYYLPLVLRTSAGWRYHGPVHEYVGPVTGEGFATVKIPDVAVAQDHKEVSAASSRKRWERDVGVLNAQLEKTPDDARSLFYLAQTHECLGNPERALALYERRIAVGGWVEETYEAAFRRAKILHAVGRPWDIVEKAYLEAFSVDPRRAEPLFKIAEHWYCAQDHHRAFLYARRAAELARPEASMFVDEEVYTWKAADIVAISGFYTNNPTDRVIGRRFAEQCVRAVPNDERMRSNWAFYAPRASEMFPGYRAKAIDFVPGDPWSPYNPSLHIDHDGTWRCIVRMSNYKIINGHYQTWNDVIHTRNVMIEFDRELEFHRIVEMMDMTGIPRSSYPCHGFEDCRLFRHDGKLCFTSTVCDFDLERAYEGPREIVLGELDENYAIVAATPLRGSWTGRAQKNWMPIVDIDGTTDTFVYATYPDGGMSPTVLKLRDRAIVSSLVSLDHGRLRGGSQLVRVPEGWLAIVHDVAWPSGGRMYLHRFALFDENLELASLSDPFHFETLGVEFCAGLAYDRERRELVASFGVEDQRAMFGIFKIDAVMAQLKADFQV